jgi:hypothetical protein
LKCGQFEQKRKIPWSSIDGNGHVNEGVDPDVSGNEDILSGGPGIDENDGGGGAGGPGGDGDVMHQGKAVEEGNSPNEKGQIRVLSRVIKLSTERPRYRIVIIPQKSASADVRLSAVGDDSRTSRIAVQKAWDSTGKPLEVSPDGIVKSVALSVGTTNHLEVELDSREHLAMEITAREA